MHRIHSRAALCLAAALCVSACGDGGRAGPAADSTVPAGTQVAPGPQGNAAPHLDTAGLPAIPPEPPIAGRDTAHHVQPGQTHASCMARAARAPEDERSLLERSCGSLPDAPK